MMKEDIETLRQECKVAHENMKKARDSYLIGKVGKEVWNEKYKVWKKIIFKLEEVDKL